MILRIEQQVAKGVPDIFASLEQGSRKRESQIETWRKAIQSTPEQLAQESLVAIPGTFSESQKGRVPSIRILPVATALGLLAAACGPTTAQQEVPQTPIIREILATSTPEPQVVFTPTFTPPPEAKPSPTSKPPEATPTPVLKFSPYGVFSGFLEDKSRQAIIGKIVISRIGDLKRLLVKTAIADISCSDGTKEKYLGASIYNLEAEDGFKLSNQARDLIIEIREDPKGRLYLVGILRLKIVPPSKSNAPCSPPPELIFGAAFRGEGPEIIYQEYADADSKVGENRTTPTIAKGQIEMYFKGPLPPFP